MNHPWLGMVYPVYPIKMVIWRLVYYGFTMFYHVLPCFTHIRDLWRCQFPADCEARRRPSTGPQSWVASRRHTRKDAKDEGWVMMSDDGCGFKNLLLIFYDLLWSFMIFYVLFSPKQDDTDTHTHTHTRRNIGFSQEFSPPKPAEWNSKFAGITQSFWGINQAQPLGDCLKIRHPNSYKILICLFNRIEVSPMFRQTQIHLSEIKYG